MQDGIHSFLLTYLKLVTHPEEGKVLGLLSRVLENLQRKGLVVEILATMHPEGSMSEVCLCIFKTPKGDYHRRLDLIIAPYSEYFANILGWSG
jgi:DNA polymerase lambda